MVAGNWKASKCVTNVKRWLDEERVVVEGFTGTLLTKMHYVQLENGAPIIAKVLA